MIADIPAGERARIPDATGDSLDRLVDRLARIVTRRDARTLMMQREELAETRRLIDELTTVRGDINRALSLMPLSRSLVIEAEREALLQLQDITQHLQLGLAALEASLKTFWRMPE